MTDETAGFHRGAWQLEPEIDVRLSLIVALSTSIRAAIHDHAAGTGGRRLGLVSRLRYEGSVWGLLCAPDGNRPVCRAAGFGGMHRKQRCPGREEMCTGFIGRGAIPFEGLSIVIAIGSLAGSASRNTSSSRLSSWPASALPWLSGECSFRFLKSPLLLRYRRQAPGWLVARPQSRGTRLCGEPAEKKAHRETARLGQDDRRPHTTDAGGQKARVQVRPDDNQLQSDPPAKTPCGVNGGHPNVRDKHQ
jgi:hypothetical protein